MMNGNKEEKFVLWFDELGKQDTSLVGGKNANLGEMITQAHVPVPPGFAITAHAYRYYIEKTGIGDRITSLLSDLDVDDVGVLNQRTAEIRQVIEQSVMPPELGTAITEAYMKLGERLGATDPWVAVRSSATAEDLPGASFAGQQETYLNVRGAELTGSVKRCFASLFTARATTYRVEKGFDHTQVYLSVGVQQMVNSKASGVMFSLHPVTGDTSVVIIEGGWGLGELVVQGSITPDEYTVRKSDLEIVEKKVSKKDRQLVREESGGCIERPTPQELRDAPVLSDEWIKTLAKYAIQLEEHYGTPQDMEWALDADTGKLYIVQSRPETVWVQKAPEAKGVETGKEGAPVETTKERVSLMKGLPASPGMRAGPVRVILDAAKIAEFREGEVLVTEMTDPDWVPAMRKAAAIVTNAGGMTCHAAIVSRELGVPCIVGSGNATQILENGANVTVDATNGIVYEGVLEEAVKRAAPGATAGLEVTLGAPVTGTKIYVNLGVPDKAEEVAKLPLDGVGLMRQEFIIASSIGEHPLHLIETGRQDVFVDGLADGIATVCRAFAPRPVVLRFSDFRTNEYRDLEGGERFEMEERNPMIGWRGASRYSDPVYKPAFELELIAIKKVREEFGLKNIWVMVPFVRTPAELKKVLEVMHEHGLESSPDFKVWMMCEVPSNVVLADRFAPMVDGFSIGSNDLTQLTLGCDRDSEKLAPLFDERDEAVLRSIAHVIKVCHQHNCTVSICGQAPSVYPEVCKFLVKEGIDSISVNPDVAVQTRRSVAQIEQRLMMERLLGGK